MDVNVILNDFERLKKACDDMAGKKILVGLVGGVDSEVLKIAIAHEYCRNGPLSGRALMQTKPSWVKSCQVQSERCCLDRPPQMPPPTPLALRRPRWCRTSSTTTG